MEELHARHEPGGRLSVECDQQVVAVIGEERAGRLGVDHVVEERLGGGNTIDVVGSQPLDLHRGIASVVASAAEVELLDLQRGHA